MLKTIIPSKLTYCIIVGILACVFETGCRSAVAPVAHVPEATPIESVLVLPFKDMTAIYGDNVSVRCPLDGKVYITGSVTQDAADMLTRHLIMLISSRFGCRLVRPSNALGVVSKLTHPSQAALPEKKLMMEIGRIVGADAVIIGHIYRFKERVGRNYSAEYPAAVTFDIHIIRVGSGRILWSGKFDETQRSLDEDLLKLRQFVKRKGRWVTARQMALSGLEELVEKFPLPGK